ncbi:hypothetical protein OE88DRAFT_425116 [Heliocybe sulcata]|uniref:DUF6593 domain-containing protein n=1 Tax=Heliocybe sulcata TaxID=5364 RepID=A0A5C3N6L6_9AGAM|nr:hypothetical protein OE88DRAFT_425116 [Heliocybe sulcata]
MSPRRSRTPHSYTAEAPDMRRQYSDQDHAPSATYPSPTTPGRVRQFATSPPAPTNPLPSPPMEPRSYHDERPPRGPPSSASSQSSNARHSGPVSPLLLTPPEARRPTAHPTRYSFSQLSPTSMIIAPIESTGPSRADDALYHISVSLNCFFPAAYTTTVRRGGSPSGPLVGEIELGNPDHKKKDRIGTVRIGSTKVWLAKVFKKGAGNHKTSAFSWKNPYSWEFPGNTQLLWNCSDHVKKVCPPFPLPPFPSPLNQLETQCHRVSYTAGRDTTPLVATFNPPHTDDKDVVVVLSPASLEVAGLNDQETLDHIVISVLLIERNRLCQF